MYKSSSGALIHKRFFDISIIVFSHILFFPVVILFWSFVPLLIWIVDRGPVFYYQTRVGKDGKPFKMIKLRTMKFESQIFSGLPKSLLESSVVTLPDDVRITSIGKILRIFRLDEVPQIINILRGEMSFVGPRPLPKETLDFYISKGWQNSVEVRLKVLPGIAGLAQLQGTFKKGESVTDTINKFRYDAVYVQNYNVCYDINLLAKCVLLVFRLAFR